MDVALLTIFRILHIFAGVFWVGAGTLITWYISPAAVQAGPAGGRFMNTLTTQTSYPAFMPLVAAVTTVSGGILYIMRGGLMASYYTSLGNWVLAIGALAGLLAFGHGSAVLGRLTNGIKEASAKMAAAQGPPPDDVLAQMARLQADLAKHSKISFFMMMVAVLGMSAARYL